VIYQHGETAMSKGLSKREKKHITSFNDMTTIVYLAIGYIGITKIGKESSI
jgi:hypothetical protein